MSAGLVADFSQETGKIRRELHSSGFGPTICSQTAQDLEDVKAMGFAYARTHAVKVKGASAVKACTVLDDTQDLKPRPAKFVDGQLTLEKADGNSAAFLVEFE